MEIKAKLDFRRILALLYVVCFGIYLVVGLTPAEAAHYNVITEIKIPAIQLESEVAALKLENRRLETPAEIVGSFSRAENKTLLIGHASTVFNNLSEVEVGDEIFYDGKVYLVGKIETVPKEEVKMEELLDAAEVDTLVMMTCAGEDLGNGDSTNRLILTAEIITSPSE